MTSFTNKAIEKKKPNTEKDKEHLRGKKRFQERLAETREADQLIKDYTPPKPMVPSIDEFGNTVWPEED